MNNGQRSEREPIPNSLPRYHSDHPPSEEPDLPNPHPNKKQASLYVAIRCRPLLKHEVKAKLYEIIRIMDKKVNFYLINS